MENVIKMLINEANKASKHGEVPVGCVIVSDGKVISKAYNKRESTNNVINHAEIIAIEKAAKRLKTWKLNGCDLYVTLKPCTMCKEIIKQSRIDNVYYLVDKPEAKKEYNKTKEIKINDSINENIYLKLMADFFSNKR